MAVVNSDTPAPCSAAATAAVESSLPTTTCSVAFADTILRQLGATTITQVAYGNAEVALRDAKQGRVWGVISFAPSFSQNLLARSLNQGPITDAMITNGSLAMNLDMTDQQVAVTIETSVTAAFITAVGAELDRIAALGVPVSLGAVCVCVCVELARVRNL